VHRERGVDACGHTYSSITTHIQQYADARYVAV
jgi:hypothetical protein